MIQKYHLLVFLLFSTLSVAGCGVDTKVNQFLKESESAGVVQQSISGYEGIGSESVSEDMLLGRQKNTSDASYGDYDDFSNERFDQALASGHQVVVSVYDESCNNCVLLDKSITSSPATIPRDVTILRVPYADGAKLYDMQKQDAVIYFDSQGEEYYRTNTLRSLPELLFYIE